MGKLRFATRSDAASYIVSNILDSESAHITCGVNRFPISCHKGVVYTSRGYIANVITGHSVVLDSSIKGGVRGAVRQPVLDDVSARYDRRWFVVTGQEMMSLRDVGDPNALAQCLWRHQCYKLARRIEEVELAVDMRRALFPDLDDMCTRTSDTLEFRIVRYYERLQYCSDEAVSMLMRNYDCDVNLALSMRCFSDASNERFEKSVKFEVPDDDISLEVVKSEEKGPVAVREAILDFSLTFQTGLTIDEFSRLRGEHEIRIFGGCPRCFVLLGFYDYITCKFKLAPDEWTSNVCASCKSNSGIYSDHPRGWPQSGISVVTQVIWEARFILPLIDFSSVGFGLISKCYGGRGLLLAGGAFPDCNTHVEYINILRGVLMCYDHGVNRAQGIGVDVRAVIRVAGVDFVVAVVLYHPVFSHGYSFVARTGNYYSITYAVGSDDLQSLLEYRRGFTLRGLGFSGICNDDVFLEVDSFGQPVDVGWVNAWLNSVSYSDSLIRLWLFYPDDPVFVRRLFR